MAKDEKPAVEGEEAPKKSKKMLFIIIILVVLLGGGAGAYFFVFKKKDAKPEPLVKGEVVPMASAMTLNLAEGHYLKISIALQLVAEVAEAPSTDQAQDILIDMFSNKEVAELTKHRHELKEEYKEKVIEAYYDEETKHEVVMDVYFTEFVMQ